MKTVVLSVFAFAAAAYSGSNEKAGKERDETVSAAAGQTYDGAGPNQRIGAAKDRAVAAGERAKDATADALTAEGRDLRRNADKTGARYDEQADAIRDAASVGFAGSGFQGRETRDTALARQRFIESLLLRCRQGHRDR